MSRNSKRKRQKPGRDVPYPGQDDISPQSPAVAFIAANAPRELLLRRAA